MVDTRYISNLTGSISEKRLSELESHPLPAIGPIARILLLCARESLDEQQFRLIGMLCTEVDDWNRFVQQASFRLIVPLVAKHLNSLPPGMVPEDALDALKNDARLAVLRNLGMIAIQHRLIRDVFEPLGARYLFFKGSSLAYRYYREPALRQFRDIDVLIPRNEMLRVGQRLREHGFRAYQNPCWATDEGLLFLQRFVGAMNWFSSDDVLIEMPSTLDGDWGRLPTDQVIERAETVNVGGLDFPVVSSLDFFCYMCKHHSRHHWARLHWIADLNAIIAHPGFDLEAHKKKAEDREFSRTVGASLEIRAAAASPLPWKARFVDPYARELFRHCLINLEGGFSQELALRESFPASEIDISTNQLYRRQLLRRNLSRFQPRGDDFLHYPLPTRWHWTYYVLRPLLWLARKLWGYPKGHPSADESRIVK